MIIMVLKEKVSEYFEMECSSPYMLLVAPVKKERCRDMSVEEKKLDGIEKLNVARSDIPAITHVDYSARVQTVDPIRHPRMHRIMSRFKERTGCPVIINTSFNVRGEPIVCTPEQAYRCFMGTNMDVLVIDNVMLYKEQQADAKKHDVDEYLAQFELD